MSEASDLGMMGLKGSVKKITTTAVVYDFDVIQEITFDREGNIAEVDGIVPKITRDELGRIASISIPDFDEDGEPLDFVSTITYDDAGLPAKVKCQNAGEEWTETYEFDADRRATARINQEGSEPPLTATFVYEPATDSHGNWLARTVASPDDAPQKETRVILYW